MELCFMAKQDTSTEFKQDEFSKIFDEYRAKIEEITRRSEKNLHIIEAKPGENHADDHEHIEVISASQTGGKSRRRPRTYWGDKRP